MTVLIQHGLKLTMLKLEKKLWCKHVLAKRKCSLKLYVFFIILETVSDSWIMEEDFKSSQIVS